MEASRAEVVEIRQSLDKERLRTTTLESEYRRLFDFHVKSYEIQMREKVSGILSGVRSELEAKHSSIQSSHLSSVNNNHSIAGALRQGLMSIQPVVSSSVSHAGSKTGHSSSNQRK